MYFMYIMKTRMNRTSCLRFVNMTVHQECLGQISKDFLIIFCKDFSNQSFLILLIRSDENLCISHLARLVSDLLFAPSG